MRSLEGSTRHHDGQCKHNLTLNLDSDKSLIHRHVDRLQALTAGLAVVMLLSTKAVYWFESTSRQSVDIVVASRFICVDHVPSLPLGFLCI